MILPVMLPVNIPVNTFPDFEEFATRRHCVWLDAATGDGDSVLAADPIKIVRAKGRQCEIITATGTQRIAGNPFDILNAEVATTAALPIGYFGYDLKNSIEHLPAMAPDDLGLPDLWFGFYDKVEVGRGVPPHHVVSSTPTARWDSAPYQRQQFCEAVRRAKAYIAAGDIYQVNLSQRFQCEVAASAPEVYQVLRAVNPAPYCAYLDIGDAQILSSSPECFLKIQDRHVITRPIKGTRPRDRDPSELLRSPKDNAELLMIVDLERNDLGRVCEYGSVHVSELKRVETFATVHHLVATIEGMLRAGVSHIDCVRACFPGGSITGAPKIRAMQIIDELEPHARGVYSGAIGYLGRNGTSHFNIAIRTVVYQSMAAGVPACGRLTFHAGGGIVADSDPDAEYEETLAKAQGIFNALDQLRLR